MRVVEYQPDTAVAAYRTLRAVGISAGVIAVILALLMMANYFSLKRTDPIHSPTLIRLLEELQTRPEDQALRNEIRELDFLARKAFFSSQHFTSVATSLLLGSLVVMVVSFKTMERYQRRLPYPDPRSPKENLPANARWARQTVTAAGLILVGFALMLALPWNSPLDEIEKTRRSAVPTKAASEPASAVPPSPTWASRADLEKNWPSFRGAAAGQAQARDLPLVWDGESGDGVIWRSEIPKPGFGSPIVWGDRVFLSGGDEEGREIYCFALEDGALRWRHEVKVDGAPTDLPKVTADTGFAASTMATDGAGVYAIFATGEIVALELEGRHRWSRALGMPDNPFGHASSLLVFEDLLIVQMDHQKKGGVFALNTRSGEIQWKSERNFGASWSSPALVEYEGQSQLILAASPPVISYDPRSGRELWRVNCLARGDVAAVPVFAHGLLYASGDNAALAAIDLKTRALAWETSDLIPGVCTPVVVGDRLIYGLADGGIVCREARTGKELWHEETDAGFYASPIVSGDRIYMLDREGTTHIFTAGDHFQLLGRARLGEEAVATPAVSGTNLIFRGTKHLYRIGS